MDFLTAEISDRDAMVVQIGQTNTELQSREDDWKKRIAEMEAEVAKVCVVAHCSFSTCILKKGIVCAGAVP